MGGWSRDELESSFGEYQRRAAESGRTGEWGPWADLFTDDATYIEHHYGTFHGRAEILRWITATMGEYPGNAMPEFPIGWSVIDEERGGWSARSGTGWRTRGTAPSTRSTTSPC